MTDEPNAAEQERLLTRFGRKFAAGEVLYNDGAAATEAYLLQEGRVRLIKRVGAVERSLRMLRPGDLFGETALTPGVPHNATAVALEAGLALVLDQPTFAEVLTTSPRVGARVLAQLIRRLREAEDQIEILMMRDAQSKTVAALLKLTQLSGPRAGGVALQLSPLELSTRVGLDVDTVKRHVHELREAGHVRVTEERIEVPDPESLRELLRVLGLKDQIVGGDTRAR